jgi:hypothetical protein
MRGMTTVYILNAKSDEKHEAALSTHLYIMERVKKTVTVLRNRDISYGAEVKDAREAALKRSDVVLMLITARFWPECYELALQARREGKRVIPVLVDSTDWKETEFGERKPLPSNEKPVLRWTNNEDGAWLDVVQGLQRVLQEVAKEKAAAAAAALKAAPPEGLLPPPRPLAADAKIRVLFVAANPSDGSRLMLTEEYRQVQDRIRAAGQGHRFELLLAPEVRVNGLAAELMSFVPHIVHFSGHGAEDGAILLVDPDQAGRSRPMDPLALRNLFGLLNDNLYAVVLNACYSSADPAQAQALADVAGCVIGMDRPINDRAAIEFAAAFYQALAFGRSLETAFELGKVGIQVMGGRDPIVPQLHVRANIKSAELFLRG